MAAEQKVPPEYISAIVDACTNQYIFGSIKYDDKTSQTQQLLESRVAKVTTERLLKRLRETTFHQDSVKRRRLLEQMKQEKLEEIQAAKASEAADQGQADWGEEDPAPVEEEMKGTADCDPATWAVPAETEENYDDVYTVTACTQCDAQFRVRTVICPLCGSLQDIGNTFTQAQRQKIKRENMC